MEARTFRPLLGVATLILCLCSTAEAQRRQPYAAHSQNFIVFAASPQWAAQVAEKAENDRRELAIHWLGSELPPWPERVPVHVESAPNLGAGGETRFSLLGSGRVGNWMMSVQGTPERILDSVLPHEITHTIFATHFAPLEKYVPRWADEGACTTVEHESEKRKHEHFLHEFLRTGRGLAFNKMFTLKEYPHDILPLYAQGHSAVQFLIDQGGPQKFIKFLEAGMRSNAWDGTLREFYAYESIGQFQTLWNQWLADGSPEDLLAYAPGLSRSAAEVQLAANTTPVNDNQVAPAAPAASVALAVASNTPAKPAGNESWYKRRLREINQESVSPATAEVSPSAAPQQPNVATHAAVAAVPEAGNYPLQPYQPAVEARGSHAPQSQATMSRPQPAQTPGIQVLDWGSSVPVAGIQQPGNGVQPGARSAGTPAMVPLYR